MNPLISGSAGLFLMAGVCGLLHRFMRNGDLVRNGAVGIRTRATMASDEAWRRGHLAAAPWVRACAATGLVWGLLALTLGLVLDGEPGNALIAVVTLGGYCAVVVLMLLAARAANRAASEPELD